MRQPNRFSFGGVPRPVDVLSPGTYNRAALDVRSPIPLTITLTNLRSLVFNIPQTRQLMTCDGALEALVDILSMEQDPDDSDTFQIRKLALQCLSQFGIRGSELIRVRTVEAQSVAVLVTILESFFRAMESEIRDGVEKMLHPEQLARSTGLGLHTSDLPNTVGFGEYQTRRRRAVTIDSVSAPVETIAALHVRLNTSIRLGGRLGRLERSPLAGNGLDMTDGPQDTNSEDRDSMMEVDSPPINAAEEVVVENTVMEVEPLRSPPPEVDTFATFVNGRPTRAEITTRNPMPLVMEISPADPDPDAPAESTEAPTSPAPTDIIGAPSPSGLGPPNAPLTRFVIPPLVRTGPAETNNYVFPRHHRSFLSALYALGSERDSHVPRYDDIVACLETLAYLSKYPKLRPYFNSTRFVPALLPRPVSPEDISKEVNVFELVEKFTLPTYHPDTVVYWASLVMRHYSRKDDVVTKRQCANFACRKWESNDPELKFIFCPTCKYPSPSMELTKTNALLLQGML
jgi:hypothetical protein